MILKYVFSLAYKLDNEGIDRQEKVFNCYFRE